MAATVSVDEVLNSFVEVMSRLLIERYQQHLAELDLTLPQAQVLRVLRRGSLPTGQLASELGISAPAVTGLTDRLLRKELIERSAAASDRRTVIVALSAKGKQLVDKFCKRRGDIFCEALAELSAFEQKQIVEALSKVLEALKRYEAEIQASKSDLSEQHKNNNSIV